MKVDIYTMSRHKFLLPISMMCGMCAFASVPTVSVTSATQRYPWNGMVDVAFTVSGDSGVKYSVSLGAQDVVGGTNLPMRTVYKADGTVAALTNVLTAGTYTWAWDATADLPNDFSCERVKVVMDATEETPRYMIVDLSEGENARTYPVSYLNGEPSGGWTDEHKTTKLVLRYISPGSFSQLGKRDVILTKAYWIGIFEVTQRQYELAVGSNPAYMLCAEKLPAIDVSYDEANVFVSRIKQKTGLSFSLPSEAQWEYACRAGTKSLYNNGGSSQADLDSVGRYRGNKDDGKKDHLLYYYGIRLAEVGQYKPNNYGLYDMHGTAQEWVEDWFDEIGTTSISDPMGPLTGTERVQRGGAACYDASYCTSNSRGKNKPSDKCMWYYEQSSDVSFGFRIACN